MTVLHMNQVSSKAVLFAVDENGDLHSSWLDNFFDTYFANLIAEHADWPHTAMFKAEVLYHTWPIGWDATPHTHFLNSYEELEEFLASYKDWAKLEDNEAKIKIWEWDLGPQFKEELHYQ